VIVDSLLLNSCTDPALLWAPTSSPGTPTASCVVPLEITLTESRLRPNRSPASAEPGTPALF
jgi:hypothetical protein